MYWCMGDVEVRPLYVLSNLFVVYGCRGGVAPPLLAAWSTPTRAI